MSILEKYMKVFNEKDEAGMNEIIHDDFKFTMHSSGNVLSKSDVIGWAMSCLLYTSPSPRDISGSRMPSSA